MYLKQLNTLLERIKIMFPGSEVENVLYTVIPKQGRLKRIFNKDISKEEYDIAVQRIIEQFFPLVLERFPFPEYHTKDINCRFELALAAYKGFEYSIVEYDDYFKVYPVDLVRAKRKEIYQEALRSLFLRAVVEGVSILDLLEGYTNHYEKEAENVKQRLLGKEMMPYYGNPDFLIQKARYIRDCANKLVVNAFGINEIVQKMEEFIDKYPVDKSDFGMEKFPFYSDDYKRDYDQFEKCFKQVLDVEKELAPLAEERWKKCLTNPNQHDNKRFGYVVHVFSGGMVDPKEMHKACCTLATPNLLTTPYGDSGLIFDFDMEHVDTICTEDSGSWLVTKEEFIERGFLTAWQLVNPEKKQNVFYEYPCVSKLVLPEDLEKIAIENNARYNGEELNYDKGILYTEIFLTDFPKAVGVFYTDACTDVDRIRAYAEKYNLPLVNLSLKALRDQRKNSVDSVHENVLEEEIGEYKTL